VIVINTREIVNKIYRRDAENNGGPFNVRKTGKLTSSVDALVSDSAFALDCALSS